ncbi:hypothetical protein BD779DRAFT_486178 [Infundibulicybe gibba]|nr:hypothetical protein BD779DRAFT_486178 [Infundibulicybe gibba]
MSSSHHSIYSRGSASDIQVSWQINRYLHSNTSPHPFRCPAPHTVHEDRVRNILAQPVVYVAARTSSHRSKPYRRGGGEYEEAMASRALRPAGWLYKCGVQISDVTSSKQVTCKPTAEQSIIAMLQATRARQGSPRQGRSLWTVSDCCRLIIPPPAEMRE